MSAANDNMSITSAELRETKKQLKELKKEINTKVYTLNKVFYNIKVNNKFYKKFVESYNIYGSGAQGTKIVNAVTGEKMPHLVGSSDEDLYFKVISTTVTGSNGPVTLFYNSPAEYELHQDKTIHNSIRDSWREKKQSHTGVTVSN